MRVVPLVSSAGFPPALVLPVGRHAVVALEERWLRQGSPWCGVVKEVEGLWGWQRPSLLAPF